MMYIKIIEFIYNFIYLLVSLSIYHLFINFNVYQLPFILSINFLIQNQKLTYSSKLKNKKLFNMSNLGDPKLICENNNCQKSNSTKNIFNPVLALCCSKVLCVFCYDCKDHACSDKKTVHTEQSQTMPCSRCKIKSSLYQCENCNSEYFCQQCCSLVHTSQKFSFHKISIMSKRLKVNKKNSFNQEQKQKRKIQNFHKENIQNLNYSNKLSKNKLQSHQSSHNKDFFSISSIVNFQQKIDSLMIQLNLKKSLIKMKQVQIKEKWKNAQKSINQEETLLKNKLSDGFNKIRQKINNQTNFNFIEANKIFQELGFCQFQGYNMKNLLIKCKKIQSFDVSLAHFLTTKFNKFQEQIKKSLSQHLEQNNPDNSYSQSILSKDFDFIINKANQVLESLKLVHLFKTESEIKLSKQHSENNLLLLTKQKKKNYLFPATPHNSSKNNINHQTYRNISYHYNSSANNNPNNNIGNNISQGQSSSYQNQNCTNLKCKKRKISIELYEMKDPPILNGENISQQMINDNKLKDNNKLLTRIKSFDYLSSTKISLQSITEIKNKADYHKTNKKGCTIKLLNTKRKENNPSCQDDMSLSFIKKRIQDQSCILENSELQIKKLNQNLKSQTKVNINMTRSVPSETSIQNQLQTTNNIGESYLLSTPKGRQNYSNNLKDNLNLKNHQSNQKALKKSQNYFSSNSNYYTSSNLKPAVSSNNYSLANLNFNDLSTPSAMNSQASIKTEIPSPPSIKTFSHINKQKSFQEENIKQKQMYNYNIHNKPNKNEMGIKEKQPLNSLRKMTSYKNLQCITKK